MKNHELSSQVVHRVVASEIVGNYNLRLKFDNDSERTIDFIPILTGAIFSKLLDQVEFNRVTLDKSFDTLIWPSGADIDPMVLYNWPDHVENIINRRRRAPVSKI